MKLVDILVRDACRIEMTARTKKEALKELSGALCESVDGLIATELLDMLLEREKLGTTAMGDGVAIPHARMESLGRLLGSFGRSREGVEFDSIDGEPANLFFLLVAPGQGGSAHLLTLAKLSRMLGSDEFRARLAELQTADELFAAIEEEEAKH